MRIPIKPPEISSLLQGITPEILLSLASRKIGPTAEGKYRHWSILQHLTPPEGLSSAEWWLAIKMARRYLYQELPLLDKKGSPFVLAVPHQMQEMLHWIDMEAGGSIKADERIASSAMRDSYLFRSLTEEAITSSQLEGASTTRKVAKEMIRSGRTPQTTSEWMIYNNFQAMQFVRSIAQERLTPDLVLELHRIVTHNTLEDSSEAGSYRTANDNVAVWDNTMQQILHMPPHADELPGRMQRMCDFANTSNGKPFIHPVVRAILLHFWLAYDHPFTDGNGRTSRALFYWLMAREGYWLAEYISISRILRKAPLQYARAFLYTETDDNDTTYFVLNQLRVVTQAIEELHDYLRMKSDELGRTHRLLYQSSVVQTMLNDRQLSLVNHALKHPGFHYTIESHQRSHGVTYETARRDLLSLTERNLLIRKKRGRAFYFEVPTDLSKRLGNLDQQ